MMKSVLPSIVQGCFIRPPSGCFRIDDFHKIGGLATVALVVIQNMCIRALLLCRYGADEAVLEKVLRYHRLPVLEQLDDGRMIAH